MGAIAVPVAPGKYDAWQSFAEELKSSRADDFQEFNERMGLTSHRAWLQETPDGHLVIAVHDGPGADEFMPKLAQSDHPFDSWFREQIEDIHAMNISEPPPGGFAQQFI